MRQLYDRHFPADWILRMGEPEVWQRNYDVDPGELWETHHALKNLLLTFRSPPCEPPVPASRRE